MRFVFIRIGIVFFVSLNVVCFYWANLPSPPVRTTVGALAEKNANFGYRRVVLTNGILGERSGRYIRFKSTVESRHDVVLVLSNPDDVPEDCTVFQGYCYGLQDEADDDCPFSAPFILVEFAQPGR